MHAANLYYSGKVHQWQIDANLDGVWNDAKTWNNTDETINLPSFNRLTLQAFASPTLHFSLFTLHLK